MRPESIKLLEENIGSKLSDTALSDMFLNIPPWAKEAQEKNKQMGLHQAKKFLHSKGNHQ